MLVHEATHFYDVFSAGDNYYGMANYLININKADMNSDSNGFLIDYQGGGVALV